MYELCRNTNVVANVELQKYKTMNTIVVDKSGEELIKIISESVGRMLRRKMDAVRCILQVAENAAEEYQPSGENLTYVSGKYSPVFGSPEAPPIPENMQANASIYRYLLFQFSEPYDLAYN